ncbi:MAG: hypothetical protein GKS02_00085 [Alphaproteobacteria bacterium]|nr:hypothetical protein [Alphaproteobacteria bacterium]
MSTSETIDGSGYPLAFKVRQGGVRSPLLTSDFGRDVFIAEARTLSGYQKEAVVSEGSRGSAWRMTTDEGKHIKGTDLAPFPLGFYNAGLHADLLRRILVIARARSMAAPQVEIKLQNFYFLDGSFVRGDGIGGAEPAKIEVKIQAQAPSDQIAALVYDAVRASPALATMRSAVTNTFAIYVNGRRRKATTLKNSTGPDAADPFLTYSEPPAPLDGANDLSDLIRKTGKVQTGDIVDVSDGTIRRVVRTVSGASRLLDPAGITDTNTWLEMPGLSHFAFKSDDRMVENANEEVGPSGLALIAAGIVFCYMTQLSRYIIHQKFDIHGVRIVQRTPFAMEGDPGDGSWTGNIEPVDTHLFLNGGEDDEAHERLMTIAANTCYLHATLAARLDPIVSIEHNGKPITRPVDYAATGD